MMVARRPKRNDRQKNSLGASGSGKKGVGLREGTTEEGKFAGLRDEGVDE